MANTKSSSLREVIIDRCLSGEGGMSVKQIWNEVNRVLVSHHERPIHSRVTILQDINNISYRWNAEICENRVGKVIFYRYKDPQFSIFKAPLKADDIQKLNQTIDLLKHFIGMPQFEWVEELNARVQAATYSDVGSLPIVTFAHNPEYAQSLRHFAPLFNCIKTKTAIELTYQKFHSEEPRTYVVHPYHLKEFVGRWYLIASVDHHPDSLTCFAFDRIVDFKRSDTKYRENTRFDIDEYFNSMVGLSIYPDTEPRDIELWVNEQEYPYLMTNPIHHSQKYLRDQDGGKVIGLHLYINYELEMRVLSYGEGVRVLAPQDFVERIKSRVDSLVKLYNTNISLP